ncbi:hypothetical protein [Larkinella sp.]|uniref:hypothetical protein n=1 Tax=Larkinella sp. TaxID=2034517 RepID=UPI003BAB71B9
MSTGQISSRVGDSASNPAKNSSNTVQTVASQDETSISSFVTRANSQVEAAIAYLIKDYEGSDIPDNALHELAGQIKNIISLTFTGEAGIAACTTLPIYVQVPEFIAERLNDPDRLCQEVKYAAEAMRDFARDRPAEKEQQVNYDGVYDSLVWMVDAASRTFEGRLLGTNPVCPTPVIGTPTSFRNVKTTFLDVSETTYNPQVVIQSDGMLFDLLSRPDDLAQVIENVSAWYIAWVQDIENQAGDIKTSHLLFTALMEFLPRLTVAVSEKKAEADLHKFAEDVEVARLKAKLAAVTEQNESSDKYLALLSEYGEHLKAAIASADVAQTEIKRLRDLYEPATPATEGGANNE